eukprot:3931873-Amphidinium_carterae.1
MAHFDANQRLLITFATCAELPRVTGQWHPSTCLLYSTSAFTLHPWAKGLSPVDNVKVPM